MTTDRYKSLIVVPLIACLAADPGAAIATTSELHRAKETHTLRFGEQAFSLPVAQFRSPPTRGPRAPNYTVCMIVTGQEISSARVDIIDKPEPPGWSRRLFLERFANFATTGVLLQVIPNWVAAAPPVKGYNDEQNQPVTFQAFDRALFMNDAQTLRLVKLLGDHFQKMGNLSQLWAKQQVTETTLRDAKAEHSRFTQAVLDIPGMRDALEKANQEALPTDPERLWYALMHGTLQRHLGPHGILFSALTAKAPSPAFLNHLELAEIFGLYEVKSTGPLKVPTWNGGSLDRREVVLAGPLTLEGATLVQQSLPFKGASLYGHIVQFQNNISPDEKATFDQIGQQKVAASRLQDQEWEGKLLFGVSSSDALIFSQSKLSAALILHPPAPGKTTAWIVQENQLQYGHSIERYLNGEYPAGAIPTNSWDNYDAFTNQAPALDITETALAKLRFIDPEYRQRSFMNILSIVTNANADPYTRQASFTLLDGLLDEVSRHSERYGPAIRMRHTTLSARQQAAGQLYRLTPGQLAQAWDAVHQARQANPGKLWPVKEMNTALLYRGPMWEDPVGLAQKRIEAHLADLARQWAALPDTGSLQRRLAPIVEHFSRHVRADPALSNGGPAFINFNQDTTTGAFPFEASGIPGATLHLHPDYINDAFESGDPVAMTFLTSSIVKEAGGMEAAMDYRYIGRSLFLTTRALQRALSGKAGQILTAQDFSSPLLSGLIKRFNAMNSYLEARGYARRMEYLALVRMAPAAFSAASLRLQKDHPGLAYFMGGSGRMDAAVPANDPDFLWKASQFHIEAISKMTNIAPQTVLQQQQQIFQMALAVEVVEGRIASRPDGSLQYPTDLSRGFPPSSFMAYLRQREFFAPTEEELLSFLQRLQGLNRPPSGFGRPALRAA